MCGLLATFLTLLSVSKGMFIVLLSHVEFDFVCAMQFLKLCPLSLANFRSALLFNCF